MSKDESPTGNGFVTRPLVARLPRTGPALAGYAVAAVAGFAVLIGMSSHREAAAEAATTPIATNAHGGFTPPETLPAGAVATSTAPAAGGTSPAPQFAVDNSVPSDPVPMAAGTAPMPMQAQPAFNPAATAARYAAPALVVDLGDARDGGALPGNKTAVALANPALAQGDGKSAGGEGQFLQAVSGENATAYASKLDRLDAVITEGTVIGATLETAINSDLPGFARAVVSRDVMSFDGTRLLIPRGSRVVGEYKSGVAAGASRVFVIWTRLIRPDGVSIQLASPGGDDLGRGGLSGKIDRHFLQRFGGSLLMSVVNGGINAGIASIGHGLPVYINSVSEAGNAAASAFKTTDIPPTIKAAQGSAVKIFVARDLDFSRIETAR